MIPIVCQEFGDDIKISDKTAMIFMTKHNLDGLEKETFYSASSLLEALKVSRSTMLNYLPDLLEMKNFHLRRIPDKRTGSLPESTLENCFELLPM
jgi:hypothetical protein